MGFGGLDIIYMMEVAETIAEGIESLQYKSAEEIADFCIENDIPPNEIMRLANVGVKYLREKEGIDDPREVYPGVFDYLESKGFTYDEEERRVREICSRSDSQ
jgi:hypothetical protein